MEISFGTGGSFNNGIGIVIGIIFLLGGIALLFSAFKKMREFMLVADTPTSKIRSMAMGLVEIHGKVLAKETIKAPFSGTDCVYYKYDVKEYRRHTDVDSNGHTTTRYSWDDVWSGKKYIAFYAKDETGSVLINPDKAEFDVTLKRLFYQRAGIFGNVSGLISFFKNIDSIKTGNYDIGQLNLEPMNFNSKLSFKKILKSGSARVGDRKYFEYFLEPGENLYLLGTSANDASTGNSVVIKKGENEKTFIISNKSEKKLSKTLKWKTLGLFLGSATFIVVSVIVLFFLL